MSRAVHTRSGDATAFVTKDGSLVRELMHPAKHACRAQSLAEALVEPGAVTALHLHRETEELYFILEGSGEMTLGERQFNVSAGDTICIAPGTAHRIRNTGPGHLRILCSCSPAYRDDDTELVQSC
jgi:mannose-6-phosphate isomerase-like protein (cupin superfamily)